jgi:hypothetical protein
MISDKFSPITIINSKKYPDKEKGESCQKVVFI